MGPFQGFKMALAVARAIWWAKKVSLFCLDHLESLKWSHFVVKNWAFFKNCLITKTYLFILKVNLHRIIFLYKIVLQYPKCCIWSEWRFILENIRPTGAGYSLGLRRKCRVFQKINFWKK
jgi:hypothetical protein